MPNRRQSSKFLNVDLGIYSRSDLSPLVAAMGKEAIVLYSGREGSMFSAHLELSLSPKSADEATRGLVRLITRLPRPARMLWNAAAQRIFNIGIQSGEVPTCYEVALAATTLRDVSSIKGQIAVTVYGRIPKARTKAKRERR
jgi:hypothetical protein